MNTERVARWGSAHPWRVVLGWTGAVALSALVIAALLGGALTPDSALTNDAESERAYALLAARHPRFGDASEEIVVVRSESLTVDERGFREKVEGIAGAIERTAGAPAFGPTTRPAPSSSFQTIDRRR